MYSNNRGWYYVAQHKAQLLLQAFFCLYNSATWSVLFLLHHIITFANYFVVEQNSH